MLFDTQLHYSLEFVSAEAAKAEEAGYAAAWRPEIRDDPFVSLAAAAQRTASIRLGTGVAIAFARSPMIVAYAAHGLQRLSGGRLLLGLGTQIRPHITNRFSMPWSEPAERMREYVRALRSIWQGWNGAPGEPFRGRFYTHSLMTPEFTPPASQFGPPPIYLAAVGPRMLEVCGAVADGWLAHPFCTADYLRTVGLPTVARARAETGRTMDAFEVSQSVFAARDDLDIAAVRHRIAFYASTPAYRAVLELHGYGDLQEEARALTKAGRWHELSALVDDRLLSLMCVTGDEESARAEAADRFGDLVQRVQLGYPTHAQRERAA
ncbi:TIGR03617 family F420-dependent LLM class oxidoreductase [Pseudonocardia eucalypti]|uniref:TIGR03617 family F420-dependent LLM class oxidoreductase n=1 Tax=Pseudonocardia eucalypti TaxID=648755 RepID=A0ABP9QJX2_9PSEU|nr:putative F420-dependent oxidoreductase [Pseudonocardia eucalypti]